MVFLELQNNAKKYVAIVLCTPSELSSQEDQQEEHQMEMEMNDEKSFFRRIKKINLDQRYLIIPHEFFKKNPECFHSDHITAQKHPGSTPWHISFSIRRDNGGVQLGRGWPEFVSGNNIQHGDIIIFRLAQGSFFTFDVYDPDGLEKPPPSSTAVALAPAPVHVQPLKVKKEVVSDTEDADSAYDEQPDSEASLSRSQVSRSFSIQLSMLYIMYVPVPHHMNFPDEKATIVLEDPWNREWAVKWNPEIRQLTKGLVTFLRANNIQVGDTVLLEPVRVGRLKARKVSGR